MQTHISFPESNYSNSYESVYQQPAVGEGDCSNEIWKDIPGWEGKYMVSNKGHIMSCKKKKNMYSHQDKKKYVHVELWKNGKRLHPTIHRIIAKAFIPNPLNKPEVNHIDGNPSNNKVSNLEWVTKSENSLHAFHVLKKKTRETFANYWKGKPRLGKFNERSIPVLMYDKQGNFIAEYESQNIAARETKIKQNRISQAINNIRPFGGGFIWKKKLACV